MFLLQHEITQEKLVYKYVSDVRSAALGSRPVAQTKEQNMS